MRESGMLTSNAKQDIGLSKFCAWIRVVGGIKCGR